MSVGGAGSLGGGGAGVGVGVGAGVGAGLGLGLGLGLGDAGGSFAAVVGAGSLPPPQATSTHSAVQATAIGNTLPGFREYMDAPSMVGATHRF
jgi:hypothetical protein